VQHVENVHGGTAQRSLQVCHPGERPLRCWTEIVRNKDLSLHGPPRARRVPPAISITRAAKNAPDSTERRPSFGPEPWALAAVFSQPRWGGIPGTVARAPLARWMR